MLAMPSVAVMSATSSWTRPSSRSRAITEKISANTNNPTLYRTTLSRSSVVAMMRGVSCPPAICTATSSEPKVKTRNDSVSEMMV